MKRRRPKANLAASRKSAAAATPSATAPTASIQRYKALYDANPSMYFTVDRQGAVLSVNRFGAEQLGYEVEELVGQSVFGVFHEDDKEAVRTHLATCMAQLNKVHQWEIRKVRKDGTVLWVREMARGIVVPDDGEIILIVCEDITRRKEAEEALRRKPSYKKARRAIAQLLRICPLSFAAFCQTARSRS